MDEIIGRPEDQATEGIDVADVVSVASSEPYPVDPAVVESLLEQPGSLPEPRVHRAVVKQHVQAKAKAKSSPKAKTKARITKKGGRGKSKAKAKSSPKVKAKETGEAESTVKGVASIVFKQERGHGFYQLRRQGQSLVQITLNTVPDAACKKCMLVLKRAAERGASRAELKEKKQELVDVWRRTRTVDGDPCG